MASIVPCYEYDIFISYRQKDNKHDGWVTEFVNNLKGELESTLKEEISVYFDFNPHDGLLETHDVNASLKEKLKCLIFIPIISQTYCDPKSFAWKHEFVAFNRMAKEDQFGRDIKLAGGNVASRILPVKIHDLDAEDKALLENELGGVLRGIEFIYKSPGVNRSLRSSEDHAQDNLNKSYYRDQINKVANAVKDIILAIKKYDKQDVEVLKKDTKEKKVPGNKLNLKIIIGSFLVLVLIMLGYFFIPKLSESAKTLEKTIAVLPFRNLSNDSTKIYFCDGFMEEILNNLQRVKEFTVRSRTSTDQYRKTTKTIRTIGEEMNVNYLIEGSVGMEDNYLRIWVQLINAKTDEHVWTNDYTREMKQIFSLQSEIAKEIAVGLKTILSPEEITQIDKKYTNNPEAYQLYLQGRYYYLKFAGADGFNKAIDYFKAAIKIEPDYALAYAGIATSYFSLWFFNYSPPEKCLPQMKHAIQQCLQFDDESSESHLAMGYMKMYYEWDFASAAIEFKKAIELNPNFVEAHQQYAKYLGHFSDYTEAIKHASIAYSLDPFSLLINYNVAVAYWMVGDYEKVLEFGRRSVELEQNFYSGHFLVGRGLMGLNRYEEAVPEFEIAVQQNYGSHTLLHLGLLYGLMGEKVKTREVLEKMETLRSTQWVGYYEMGVVYMAIGEFDNAFQYFEKAIEKHEGMMIYLKCHIRLFPEFEKDPRTKQLIEKIGLPYP